MQKSKSSFKKSRISWIFFYLLCCRLAFADHPSLYFFFSDSSNKQDVFATFKYTSGRVNVIEKLYIYYLTTTDCSEGLIYSFESDNDIMGFPVYRSENFVLKSTAIYLTGARLLGVPKMQTIHSILVRFMSRPNVLSHFAGHCADQKINCCIPVKCSEKADMCVPVTVSKTELFSMVE